MNGLLLTRVAYTLRFPILVAAVVTVANFAIAQEPPENLTLHEAPRLLPALAFQDDDGMAISLDNFRGKTVLLNIWATWCGPCKREMPTLDGLQAQLGGPLFEVVALSIDRAGLEVVRKFYDEIGIKHLNAYIDSSGMSSRELHIAGLPTTLLVGPEGRELGRLVGATEWDSPEMIAFLRKQIAKKN